MLSHEIWWRFLRTVLLINPGQTHSDVAPVTHSRNPAMQNFLTGLLCFTRQKHAAKQVRKWCICLIQRSDCANVATAVLLFIFKRQLFKWKWFWFWISLSKCLHSIVVDTKCKIKWYYWFEFCTKWKCQLRHFHHSSGVLPECPLERVNCCEFVHVSPSLAVSLLSVKSDELLF